VLWKTALPAGHSSPCIWEDRIFITGATNNKLQTFCLERQTGKILWQAEVEASKSERGKGGSAAPTPVTDGQCVYVYFGPFGVLCYDVSGKEQWRKPLAAPNVQHGTGVSPVLAAGKLILNRDQDTEAHLLALDARTGDIAWKADRPEVRRGFSTPLAYPLENPEVILLPGTLRLVAYELSTGKERWYISGLPNEMVTSPVTGQGMVFVAGWTPGVGTARMSAFDTILGQLDRDKDGKIAQNEAVSGLIKQNFTYFDANKDGFINRAEWEAMVAIMDRSENVALAVRPDGRGDVTKTHVVWTFKRGLPYVPSPLYYEGRIYLVKNGGLATCLNAATGEPLYQEERLGALGDYYSSLVAAGGNIFAASQAGSVTVFKAGDKLEVLALNKFDEPILTTPALLDGKLYLRTQKYLYAIGK
jgi:outer membrane protein assembly factor BamB